MKILMITPDYPPNLFGGIGTFVDDLVSTLKDRDCEITLLVARLGRFEEYSYVKEERLTVINVPIQQENNDLAHILEFGLNNLNKQLLEFILTEIPEIESFDAIHVHNHFHATTAVTLKGKFNLPIVTTIHSMVSPPEEYLDSIKRHLILNSDSVITVSKYIRDIVIRRYKIADEKKVSIIYSGIMNYSMKESLKRAMYPNGENFNIIFCGRLNFVKGCIDLIYAMHIVSLKYPHIPVKLSIIGDGSLKKELEKQVDNLKLNNHISFLGFLKPKEVRKKLRQSRLQVIPSLNEGLGLVALEAMSEGIPVISTNVGGLAEFVTDGITGVVIQPNRPEELAENIIKIITDKKLSSKLALNGLMLIEKKFNWAVSVNEVLNIYKGLPKFSFLTTKETVNHSIS